MLQQTQVVTVKPYYQHWIDHFPDIRSLARAELDDVLKIWEGLGYYSRARNLHLAAKQLYESGKSQLPTTIRELLKLPGIGPYTSAAISSFAFKQPIPLVDGNILRVFSRVTVLEQDISLEKTKRFVKDRLDELIDSNFPGEFNQALMDLGRDICTPKQPSCTDCPLQPTCIAQKENRIPEYPVRRKKPVIPEYQIVIGLIRKGKKLLIQQRKKEGLLGGLWEFPGGKIKPGESAKNALLREIVEETSLIVQVGDRIGTIKHAYSHFRIVMTAFHCSWISGQALPKAAIANRWVYPWELEQFAFPRANTKILDLIDLK